jgi:hypothetical protein
MTAQNPLDDVTFGLACCKRWNELAPQDDAGRVRHCRSCRKNVYNLSGLNREEAETLIEAHEGHLAVQLVERTDGKIIPQNTPEQQEGWRRTIRSMLIFVGVFLFFNAAPVGSLFRQITAWVLQNVPGINILRKTDIGQDLIWWLTRS